MADGDKPVVDVVKGESTGGTVLPAGMRTTTVRVIGQRSVAAASLGPDRFDDAGLPTPQALPLLASALAQAAATPDARLLVAGHGSDAAVAARRATMTWAVLSGDAAALAGADAAAIDAAIAAALGVDPLALAALRAVARPAKCSAASCGAAWAPAAVRLPGLVAAGPERVDVLVFAGQDAPALDCHAGEACVATKCDVYRKGKYKAVMLEAPPPGKTVHVLELPEPDAFLLAKGEHVKDGVVMQAGPPGDASLLQGLAHALRFLASGEGRRVVVAAHSPTAKDETSRLRAESVLAFLQGRDAWAEHAKRHAQPADWQQALIWIAADRGWPDVSCGKADGLAWGGSQAALRAFRKRYKEAFGTWIQSTGNTPALADWKAFFDVYDARVRDALGEEPGPLRARVAPLEPGAVSCAAAWPPGAVEVFRWLGQRPDRLDVLCFEAPDVPDDLTSPLAAIYSGLAYAARYLVPGLDAHQLHVRVVDEKNRPVTGADWEARLDGKLVRAGALDAQGELKVVVRQGTYDVRILRPIAKGDDGQEPWQGGDGSLEALLRGDYQRRGSYDLGAGFKNPDLQRFLLQAAGDAGVDPAALESESGSSGSTGDSEQGSRQGLPQWLKVFQQRCMTAASWGTQQQVMSRLMGAFYHAYFVETFLGPAGIAMPSNVEYFLEHLGMSTGNGAATMENMAASTDYAYCAAASSKSYLKGLERFGYKTTAIGFAPGKPPKSGHGCQVAVEEGRKAGEAHRPQPGDVLSVRTAIGPITGHVVTVVWAETDGTKTGQMWYVSGNAACRSISCDFVKVVDEAGRPPRGAIAVINRCHNHALQPDRLAAMSAGDLEAKGCSKLNGTFPGANQPGQLPPAPPVGPAAADLVASGDAPATPCDAPGPAVVLKAELRVARFVGQRLPAQGSKEVAEEPSDQLRVVPGCTLRLQWLVQGAERVVLQPGELDLTEQTRKGQLTLDLEPAKRPPGEGGKYVLEAWSGARSATAEVTVRGIIDFRVTGRTPDDPKKKRPELLERVMAGKKYGTPGFTAAESVGALPGSFRKYTKMEDQDFQHWWWGQITPKADAVLTWTLAWPTPPEVLLCVNRASGSMKPLPSEDATSRTSLEGGLWRGRHEAITEKKYRTFFEADLAIVDPTIISSGTQEVEQATIRLRENYDMPGIASFTVVVDGSALGDGSTMARDAHPVLKWELKGDHRGCGLRGEIADASNRTMAIEPIREWVKDGESPTAAHKASLGEQAVAATLQDGPEGEEARVHLELFNRFGRVERKTVKVRLTGRGSGPPPAGPTRIRLFGNDGRAMPKAAYELRSAGGLLKQGAADATGYVDGQGLPAVVTVKWGPGLKHVRDIRVDFSSGSEEDKARGRLSNMGYPVEGDLARAVRLFQARTPGLSATGQLDDETRRQLQLAHDGGAEQPRG